MKLDPNGRYVENTESGEIYAYDPIYLSVPHIREYFGHRKGGGNTGGVGATGGGNKGGGNKGGGNKGGGNKGGGNKGAGNNKTGKPDAVTTTKNTLTPESTSATPSDIFNNADE
jgi:hypothetical protein